MAFIILFPLRPRMYNNRVSAMFSSAILRRVKAFNLNVLTFILHVILKLYYV